MPSIWPLTGREQLLAHIQTLRADNSVSGIVLTGEAGVGKTRLGEEALRATTMPTARVVGHPATQHIPLGALAHLLPRLHQFGDDDDRAAMFHHAQSTLRERADGARLQLLIDDVDQLDDTSLALLLPLAVDCTIFTVATIRSGRALPSVIATLVKDSMMVVDEVPPLTARDMASLIGHVLDGPASAATILRLAEVCEGNLQMLRELLRRAQHDGLLRRGDDGWELSALPTSGALEELVGVHLADLDDAARDAVELVAVAGAVGLRDLEQLTSRDVVEALDRRGVIHADTDGARLRVRLAHPMYGEVVRSQLSLVRVSALERRLADRLERSKARRRDDVSRLALWRLDGGGEVTPSVLLEAARTALIGRDTTLALRLAAAAGERGAAHDAARVAVEAAAMRADVEGVERAAAAVWDDDSLPDAHRAHLARRLASMRFGRGDLDGAVAALQHAAARVREPMLLAAVHAQRGNLLAQAGQPLAALAALESLADTEDPQVQVQVAAARSVSYYSIGRFDDALTAARYGAAAQARLPAWLARRGAAAHLLNEAHAFAYCGRFDEARALIADGLAAAQAANARAAEAWLHIVHGEVERDTGHGAAAVRWFRSAVELADASAQQAALVWAWVGVAQGNLLLGDCVAAEAAMTHADAAGDSPLATSHTTRERTRAWLMACRGELAGARALTAEVADAVGAEGIAVFEAVLRHDLVRFGDPEAAVDRMSELVTMVEGPLVRALAAHARAAVSRRVDHYRTALDQLTAVGSLVFAAETAVELSELLHGDGNVAEAAAVRREAIHLVALSGGAGTPGLAGLAAEPLTSREREVATMAADGATSKDIAAALYLSRRTVETHLDRVYRKLGINGRVELANVLSNVIAAAPDTIRNAPGSNT
jgi:DNA-binding CsgD family transcriptional regulator